MVAVGGEELSTLSLGRELIGRGYRVSIVGSKGPLWGEFQHVGVETIDSGPYRRSLGGIRVQAEIIRRVVGSQGIDVIHSQSVFPTLAAAWALRGRKSRRVPLIFHDRGIREFSYIILGPLFNHLTECVIANSDYERSRFLRNGLSLTRCVRIHNCVNLDLPAEGPDCAAAKRELGIPEGKEVVGTVGRLVKEKAYDSLLKAFALSLKVCPNTVLLIVGDGPLRGRLEDEAERLGIRGRVVFAGGRRDLQNIYPLMDIFVLSSVFESFGNVALEAALFGKAVVATRVGGLPEAVVDGETGILVVPSDIDALAAAVIRLLQNTADRRALGEAGRRRVLQYFTPERVADEVEQVYAYALSRCCDRRAGADLGGQSV